MSSLSTVTIGADTFDVYGTTAEIASYLNGRLGVTAFTSADADDKSRAHVQATRWIDSLRWQGTPTDTVTPQVLAWPRTGVTDCDGTAIADDDIPDALCAAVAELVLIVLQSPTTSDLASTAKNIKKVGAGSAQVEFFRGGDAQGGSGSPLPTQAWRLVKCFAGSGSQASRGAISSGTDVCSQFDYPDRYELRYGEGFP